VLSDPDPPLTGLARLTADRNLIDCESLRAATEQSRARRASNDEELQRARAGGTLQAPFT